MKYKVTCGAHKGKIVFPLESMTGKLVKVRLVDDNQSFTVETKNLEPIYEEGSIVSIDGVHEMKFMILSTEKVKISKTATKEVAFVTPTKPEWGYGRVMLPISILRPVEDDPITIGDQVSIIGCPDILYNVVAIEKGRVKLSKSDPESGTFEFVLPAAFLQLSS